jgi:hypothetical protein
VLEYGGVLELIEFGGVLELDLEGFDLLICGLELFDSFGLLEFLELIGPFKLFEFSELLGAFELLGTFFP